MGNFRHNLEGKAEKSCLVNSLENSLTKSLVGALEDSVSKTLRMCCTFLGEILSKSRKS